MNSNEALMGPKVEQLLNNSIRFRIHIEDQFNISYDNDQEWTFNELEIIAQENFKYWQKFSIDVNPGLQWANLVDKVNDTRNYMVTLTSDDMVDIHYALYSKLSPNSWDDSDNIRIYQVYVYGTPISRDSSFSKIRDFVEYYYNLPLDTPGDQLQYAIGNLVLMTKDNKKIGTSFNSSQANIFYPALYLLKKEVSGERETQELIEKRVISPLLDRYNDIEKLVFKKSLEVTDFADDMHKRIQEQFDNKNTDIEFLKSDIECWYEEEQDKFKGFTEAFKKKLAYEEPEKLWGKRACLSTLMAIIWALITAITAGGMLYCANQLLITFYHSPLPENELSSYVSKSFILVALISFMIYIMRIFIKLMMSSGHLASEYRQKVALTRFYRALLYIGIEISAEEKLIIMNSLFSKIDTGLVKIESGPDIDTLVSILSRGSLGNR